MSGSERLIPDNVVRDGFGPMVRPGGALKETKQQNNGINLTSGDHAKLRMSKPGTTVTSAPDAVVRKQMTGESSSVVYGVTYRCDGDTPAVSVPAGGSVVLEGCHFFKEPNTQGAGSSYITVASGGHVSCVGCHFHGEQTAGEVIKAAGAAGSSTAVGCFNATGRTHTAAVVQVVGEVAL